MHKSKDYKPDKFYLRPFTGASMLFRPCVSVWGCVKKEREKGDRRTEAGNRRGETGE